jgi:hypothetical protein
MKTAESTEHSVDRISRRVGRLKRFLAVQELVGEEGELERGQTGYLALADGEQLKAEIRWTRGNSFGARFVPAIRTFTLGRIIAGHS